MALAVSDVDAGQGIPVTGGTAGYKFVIKSVQPDNSYPTGGWAIAPGDFGLASFAFVHVQSSGGYVFSTDYTNSKVLAYRDAGSAAVMAQVPNTTDLSAVPAARVVAFGPPA